MVIDVTHVVHRGCLEKKNISLGSFLFHCVWSRGLALIDSGHSFASHYLALESRYLPPSQPLPSNLPYRYVQSHNLHSEQIYALCSFVMPLSSFILRGIYELWQCTSIKDGHSGFNVSTHTSVVVLCLC